ncbi:MAG: hypothetical protein HYY11_08960 [Candidatus Methylomirabilis oxyfera]|nr:hypothetical protein [Candidatus Methylomirabilis oxyfera]
MSSARDINRRRWRLIDQLVYDLYGLTNEEVEMVEEATKGTEKRGAEIVALPLVARNDDRDEEVSASNVHAHGCAISVWGIGAEGSGKIFQVVEVFVSARRSADTQRDVR